MGDATGHVPIEVARGLAWLGALANKEEGNHQVLHSIQWGRDLKKDGGSTVLAATDTYALGSVSVRDMDMGDWRAPTTARRGCCRVRRCAPRWVALRAGASACSTWSRGC